MNETEKEVSFHKHQAKSSVVVHKIESVFKEYDCAGFVTVVTENGASSCFIPDASWTGFKQDPEKGYCLDTDNKEELKRSLGALSTTVEALNQSSFKLKTLLNQYKKVIKGSRWKR